MWVSHNAVKLMYSHKCNGVTNDVYVTFTELFIQTFRYMSGGRSVSQAIHSTGLVFMIISHNSHKDSNIGVLLSGCG